MELRICIEYDDDETARTVFDSVGPDNAGHMESRLSGRTLVFTAESDNAGTLRNMADDLLACVRIAEESSGLVAGPVADLDRDPLAE